MKLSALAISACLAAGAAQAAPVAGFNDVTNLGGGVFRFVFDTLPRNPGDIDGTGDGLIFTGGGITITATSAQGIVRQDYPGNGGLGVLALNGGSDNLETGLGETLLLIFSRSVEVVSYTFNGLLDQNGHQDAANGGTRATTSLGGANFGDASDFDGLGQDAVPDFFSSMCVVNSTFCASSSLLFSGSGQTPFKGYLESVTLRIDPVPLPASLGFLAAGLAGLGALRRRKSRG